MSEINYLVSVVTPFHNTNLTFFKKCMESLQEQTIGFENLEWVITLHNSEEEYVTRVKEMAKPWSNMKIYELYNDNRTASSPRNHCLKHATGKYVYFLDADDFLFPYALKGLSDQMEAYGGDIGSFREEAILGTEGLQMVEEVRMKFLLDQTKPLIVLHRDSPELGDYLDPRNLTVHKMYRRALLDDHGIRFDDEIRIGEDVTFNLNCMKYVNTVVVLPQMIGYGYFMNAGSLLQSMKLTSIDGLMSMLNDRFHWMAMAAETGVDASNIGWTSLASIARMLSAPGLPTEFVESWKDRCRPFLSKFQPVKGNKKFLSQEQADGMMAMARSFYSGEISAEEINSNYNTLWEVLHRNADTDIGGNYRFPFIHSYETFCNNVPLSEYSFYEPLIELTTRIGENNIFCAEPLVGYSLTSGTTGSSRRIPYTADHLSTYAGAMREILLEENATFALLASLPKEMEYVDNTRLDSISGAVLSVLRGELGECSYSKQYKRGILTSPMELLFPEETVDLRYARLLFALLDRDVSQIVAPFTWTVLDTIQFLEKHHEELVRDIEQGTLSRDSELPEGMYDAVLKKLIADPERAQELKTLFAEGFEDIIRRIWPGCKRIVAAGTGPFSIYTRKLQFYSGDVTLHNGFYAASEAMIGRTAGAGSEEYIFFTDNAFFEFMEPGGKSEPVSVDTVEAGKDYELILTNRAGLYRYRLGDVIRIIRSENGIPVFNYEYRLHDNCCLNETVITEKEIGAVIPALEEASRADIRDFCYMENEEGGLTLLVEPYGKSDHAGRLMAIPSRERARIVDDCLRSLSSDYNTARSAGSLPPVCVRILQPETHLLYRDRRMFSEKTVPDQIKPVRLLDTEEKRRFFMFLSEE